jgi:hypothetical protein
MTVDGHTAAAQHPREYVVIGMCTSVDRWSSGWFTRCIDSRIDRERSGPLESPINSSLNPSFPSLLLASRALYITLGTTTLRTWYSVKDKVLLNTRYLFSYYFYILLERPNPRSFCVS